jgi:hypothetical protein
MSRSRHVRRKFVYSPHPLVGNWHDEPEVAIREIIDAWRRKRRQEHHSCPASRRQGTHSFCLRTNGRADGVARLPANVIVPVRIRCPARRTDQ